MGTEGLYLDLVVGPSVHAERLHLGDVGTQFPMEGGASHAEEDSELFIMLVSQSVRGLSRSVYDPHIPACPSYKTQPVSYILR